MLKAFLKNVLKQTKGATKENPASGTSTEASKPWLLVGLGNPGKAYEGHRHNVGFWLVDALLEAFSFSLVAEKKTHTLWRGKIPFGKDRQNFDVFLMKPLTFMNCVGPPVAAVRQFYKIPLHQVMAFHDDLDLQPLKAKAKQGGGAGGHNGLKSLDQHLGSGYQRLRLGIGHPGSRDEVVGYVLGNFPPQEAKTFRAWIAHMAAWIPLLLKGEKGLFLTKVAETPSA